MYLIIVGLKLLEKVGSNPYEENKQQSSNNPRSSVGRALAFQVNGRGFEPLRGCFLLYPLIITITIIQHYFLPTEKFQQYKLLCKEMGCCFQIDNQITPSKIGIRDGIIRNKKDRIEELSLSFFEEKQLENVSKVKAQLTEEDKEILRKTISEHILLYRLPAMERNRLINCFDIYECKKDTVIFKKHQPAAMFFIVKTGSVEINAQPQQQLEEEEKLTILSKGNYFGDLALLYSAPRSATVKALDDCQFYCITNQIFRKIVKETIKKNYQISKNFIQKNGIFSYLSSKQKSAIAYNTLLLKYEKGQTIFKQGDDANCFYMITVGKVELDIPGKKPLQMVIGQSFGQNSFEEKQVRSGTATAVEQTILLSISRDSLKQCLGNYLKEISFINIMKWSFNRNELLKQLSASQKQKLIHDVEISEYKNKEIICSEGQKVEFVIIVLEEKVNEEGVGAIFNLEYLSSEIQNDMKITTKLIKSGKGCLAKIKFQVIRNVLGKSLTSLTSAIPELNIQNRRFQYINQIRLSELFVLKKIGDGRCSKVYCVIDKLKRMYALKILGKKMMIENRMTKANINQKQIMSLCDNTFLVKLYRTFKDESFLYLLTNFIEGVCFYDILKQIGPCNKSKSRLFMGSLVVGLSYLHSQNIVHRDLKPENIIIDESGYLNIADFGVAKTLTEQNGFRTFTITGTPHFMAPEVINVQGYTFAVDYWSLGVILYEIVCGILPFGDQTTDPYQILRQIDAKDLEFPIFYDDQDGKQLIKKLLLKNPDERMRGEFQKIKTMKFFDSIDWQQLSKRKVKAQFKIKPNLCKQLMNEPLSKIIRKQKSMIGKISSLPQDNKQISILDQYF